MDNKNTEDKILSDIRQVERHFIDPDLRLEWIQCQNFDEFYALEKRQLSKLLAYLVPELRKTSGGKYPHKILKCILDSIQRDIQRRDDLKYSDMLLRSEIEESDVPTPWCYFENLVRLFS